VKLGKRNIVTCSRTEKLSSAMQKLQQHNLTSLPVLTQVNTYYGFIDMVDIVRFVVDLVGEEEIRKHDDFEGLAVFQNATVKEVMRYPLAKKSPFHPVANTDSLLTIVEAMAKGYHRIPVLNAEQNLDWIVSQSAMLKYVYENITLLGDRRKMTVDRLPSAFTPVISVHQEERAIDALKMLKICSVTAVSVVNDNEKLVGCLSSTDLKKIHSSGKWVARLFLPTSEFVQIYNRKKTQPLSITRDHTIEQVLKKFVKYHVHRLFVVNEDFEPVGVVSPTDIFKVLLPGPKLEEHTYAPHN
jgi:CBS-domain-containing membrane protein